MNKAPSNLWLRFFRWYCHPDYVEDLEGDLLERFERNISQYHIRKAKYSFAKDVLKLFRPGIIRPLFSNKPQTDFGMLRNYFTIATRNLLKQKLYSSINIGGLTVGLTCFILIFVYVQHELSYDNFYSNRDNIYRIYQKQEGNQFMGSDLFGVTPAGLASVLTREYSEVVRATTIRKQSTLLTIGNSSFFENGLSADFEFFQLFDYTFLAGTPKDFELANGIVLTKSFAEKTFNTKNVLGKPIQIPTWQGELEFIVTGIIEDLPKNSSLQFSYVFNILSNEEYVEASKSAKWNSNSYFTFFELHPDADPLALQSKLPEIVSKYADTEDYPFKDTYYVEPLKQLHLQSDVNFDIGLKGNIQYLVLFSVIAVIVLLLASVNYMNLAIARSIQRAKEVGLRKVIGAVRGQLIGQFLGESIFIALMGLALAIGLSYWLLPYFGAIIERPLTLDFVSNPVLLSSLGALVLLVGLFSGSYPAFFMSSLKPVNTLKGKTMDHRPKMRLQSILVILQYAASIVLIIGSLVIYLQFDFIQNKELGYDKDHIVVVRTRSSELRKNIEAVKTELNAYTNVEAVATSESLPSNINSSSLARLKENEDDSRNITIYGNAVDSDYLNIFGHELLAGRNFSSEITGNQDKVIINESAVKAFGWTPEEAIGNQFYLVGQDYVTVIGVVKDFHMFSMHLAIQPLMMTPRHAYFGHTSIKVRPYNIQKTLELIEESVQKHSKYPFEFQFMDSEFDKLYKADIKLGKIFGIFTVLSIFVASLGLFGLAAYTAQQRTKEIGIRKVLGASIQVIISLMAKDFLKMVLVGFIFAIPIAWFSMDIWLQNFAYRISMEWWMFAAAGIMAGLVSMLTIGSQSIKASLTNPVESLRSE
ncbi:MAG: ABC transporter permease [Bacteroidota bacterium]